MHISIVLYHHWHDSTWSPRRHAGNARMVMISQLQYVRI